ncbi:MAG: PKD domain-containing protein [Candidatus Micrarchaeales archaeon]
MAPRPTKFVVQLSLILSVIFLISTIASLNADQNGASGPLITVGSINANGNQVSVGGSVLAQSSAVTTLTWNWGDGQITTGSFPQTHTYGGASSYTLIITAQDSSGNTGTATAQINVYPNAESGQLSSASPEIAVDTPKVASDGETVTVGGFAGAAAGGESISTINWNWGDGTTSSGNFPQTHVYTNQGSHQISITATDNNGNAGTITTSASTFTSSTTTPPIIPLISAKDQVSGLTVSLTGTIKAQAEGAQIDWSRSTIGWGDGTNTGFTTFSHTYTKYQAYTIQLNVYDTLNNYASQQIQLNLLPSSTPGGNSPSNLAPIINVNIVQNGLNVRMTGSAVPNPNVQGASVVQLLIDWGDGQVTNGFTQYTHTYSSADDYPIQITAIDSFGNKATIQQSLSVSPGIVTPGAGGTSSGPSSGGAQCTGNPTFTLNQPTVQGLSVTVSGNLGSTVTGGTINWGDGTNTPMAQYTHSYAAINTYPITVTVTDACGNSQSETAQATTSAVTSSPTITATATVSGYSVDVSGTLTPSAGAAIDYTKSTINWGDGQTTPVTQYTHTYPSTTQNSAPITIVVTAIDTHGNSITKSLSVTVPNTQSTSPGTTACPASSTPTITLNQPSVNGMQVTVSGTVGATVTSGTINWGDGETTPISQYTHTYTSAQTYPITVTVFDSCGDNNVAEQSVSFVSGVASPPIISVTASVAGRVVTLSGTLKASPQSDAQLDPSHTTVDWGDHVITNYPTYQHTYSDDGTFNIIIIAQDTHGNMNTQELTVNVGSVPTVSVT